MPGSVGTRRIRTVINASAGKVTFTAERGVRKGLTFAAGRGDTLVWELTGAQGLTAFVTFAPQSPLAGAPALQSAGNTITGVVQAAADPGDYEYKFEIQEPGLAKRQLTCFWEDDAHAIVMGGGVITDPPPALNPGP
jgi:hypothetical protein